MPRLRWKKEPRETGLSAVGSGPRGSWLHDGDKRYAHVSAIGGDWRGPLKGWYFVAGWDSNVPHKNTCHEPVATEALAKELARKYVDEHLSR